jgi:5-methylcytosine-specific restriction endonuclease McrA
MPWKPPVRCSVPGCPALIVAGSKRCADHRRAQQDERNRTETWRDYDNPTWIANRRVVLTREPNCRVCGEPATVVDHITPLRDGGTHDLANLRPLCKPDHDRHTANQMHARRKG